ncbi:MAG: ABC transporter permease [Clostridia bacterium]|nr:ABC transporter permease [Clostridia bacterium]
MKSILKKELLIYFHTPIAWVFIAVTMCVSAIMFTMFNLAGHNSSVSMIFSLLPWIFVVMIPLLTMRLISEERGTKTDQLLLTSPISVSSIVWGKFFAALTVFAISIALMLIYPLILSFHTDVYEGVVLTNYLGFFLLGASLISVGIFISSLTENQFTAGIITIAILLAATLLGFVKGSTGYAAIDSLMSVFMVIKRFESFLIGIIDISNVVYYLSIVVIFVLLTIFRIERRKIK